MKWLFLRSVVLISSHRHCRSILYQCKSKNTDKNCTNTFFDPSAASRCKHESDAAPNTPPSTEDSRPSLKKAEIRRQKIMDLLLKEHALDLGESPAVLASHLDYPEWKERTQRYLPKSYSRHRCGRQSGVREGAHMSGQNARIMPVASFHTFNSPVQNVLGETSRRDSEDLVAYSQWFLSHFPAHLRTAEAIERHLSEPHQLMRSSTSSPMHPCIDGMCFIAPSEIVGAGSPLETTYSSNTHLLLSSDPITHPPLSQQSYNTDAIAPATTITSSSTNFFSVAYDLQGEWERYSQSRGRDPAEPPNRRGV